MQAAVTASSRTGGSDRTVSVYEMKAAPAANGSANPAISLSAVICHYFLRK